MSEKILIVATDLKRNHLPVLETLAGNYKSYFLTTPRSICSELKFKKKLKNKRLFYLDSNNPRKSLLKILINNDISLVYLFLRDSNCIREIVGDIRSFSPKSAVVIVSNPPSFINKNINRNKLFSFDMLDGLKLSLFTVYSQADVIFTETEREKNILKSEIEQMPIEVISPKREGLKKQIAGIYDKFYPRKERKTEKLTSIVLLCYNKLEYTRQCINSILKHTKIPYELIIVDNHSNDGTVKYLKSLKNVKLILNSKNYGYTAGCNQGIRKAKGDYILLLNNDVVVSPFCLERMISCAESSKSIGLVGPRTNNIYGIQQVDDIGYKNIKDMSKWASINQMANWGKWFEVLWLAGFCMLIKKKVIEKIGLLDEKYIIGTFQDHDYCLMARKSGFRLFCCNDAYVHHFGTKSYSNDSMIKLDSRNRKVFMDKWGLKAYDFLTQSLMRDFSGTS